MRKFVFITLVLLLFTGCATVKYNGATSNQKRISYPDVGQVVTAYVGDRLVEKGFVFEVAYLRVDQSIGGVLYTIPQGDYAQLGFDESNYYYSGVGVSSGVLADPVKALSQSTSNSSDICVVSVYGGKSCYQGQTKRAMRPGQSEDSFQQTLLYSGRIGDKINISYREFSNNMARDAFTNSVEYDLSASNTIGYKGALIEVIEADNQSIKYKLIRNFPDN